MKIEINGFSIEVMTDDVNLTLKVSDATGKELSNNTYSQESTDQATQTDLPSAEETSTETEETSDTPTEAETPATTDENFIPSFEQYKKLLKEGKIK